MKELINPKENIYFVISAFISILFYLVLVVSIVGIVYILILVLITWLAQGFLTAQIKANAVKISSKQFPDVYLAATKLAEKMEMKEMPDIYVMQAGGLLNAFATRFLSRDFVLIYSDVFELAYNAGGNALDFIICHELAHIGRRHIQNRWIVYPAFFIPFLGTAYSRACEYTCDNFGAHFVPKGCVEGLMMLSVGTKLYKDADVEEVVKQSMEGGMFLWLYEITSTHPILTKRIRAVKERQ
jgi:Zn-dependent protease with chaperone function